MSDSEYSLIHSWLNPQMLNGRPTMGLEPLRILVSLAGPGTSPLWIPRDYCVLFVHCVYFMISPLPLDFFLSETLKMEMG